MISQVWSLKNVAHRLLVDIVVSKERMSSSLTVAMKIPLYFSDLNCLKQFIQSPVMLDSNSQYRSISKQTLYSVLAAHNEVLWKFANANVLNPGYQNKRKSKLDDCLCSHYTAVMEMCILLIPPPRIWTCRST